MQLESLLKDKTIKSKEKTEIISSAILDNQLSTEELLEYANTAKDPIKATIIESFEFATQKNPNIAQLNLIEFVSKCLTSKAPRVKWESARVIANIAFLFPKNLEEAISNLLINTEHEGTVVRWSAALALSQIYALSSEFSKKLFPVFQTIVAREEKESIKKIYLKSMKQKLINKKL